MSDDYEFDLHAIHRTKIHSIVLGSLCTIPPLSVVIILSIRYKLLVGERRLVHYIYLIAAAEAIVSLCISLGFPVSSSFLCASQGFLTVFFSRAAIFFTDVLIFQLFYLILFKKYFLKLKYDHLIVWSLNLILQLIPFSTGTVYGQDDDDGGTAVGISIQRCEFGVGSGTLEEEILWAAYAYQLVLIVSFVFILFFTLVILVYRSRTSISEKSWSTLLLYPIGLLFTYVPSSVYGYYFKSYLYYHNKFPKHGFVISNELLSMNAVYGVILSLIFYTTNKDAVYEWKKILFGITDDDNYDNYDNRSSVISIASTVQFSTRASENPIISTRRVELD
jgi:hypothetical protein